MYYRCYRHHGDFSGGGGSGREQTDREQEAAQQASQAAVHLLRQALP